MVITRNGRPVAELHPCPSQQRRDTPFGLHPALESCGDVMALLVEPWYLLG
jgi:antitoxin (DNA-binding transcriptional repressor) of toxin-antitoxin stability system